MIKVKVNYENGDYEYTHINATPKEARAYYVGQVFNVGLGPNDNMQRCTSIEILGKRAYEKIAFGQKK